MRKCADVRKYKGKYRVYWVEHLNHHNGMSEVRYSTKVDAKDYIIRMGCYDWGWEEFDNKEEAQAWLDECRGCLWW